MYGRLGNVEMRGASPHRRICLYYVFRFFYHTLRYIIPHDKLPNLDIINLFGILSKYAVFKYILKPKKRLPYYGEPRYRQIEIYTYLWR